MSKHSERVSFAELLADDVAIDPKQVAFVIRELCGFAATEQTGAVSSHAGRQLLTPGQIWLHSSGTLEVAPGATVTVRGLGDLLTVLLLARQRTDGMRVPPGLLLISARASGQIDAPPFISSEELSATLARFEPPEGIGSLQELFARWRSAQSAIHPASSSGVGQRADEQPAAREVVPAAFPAEEVVSASFLPEHDVIFRQKELRRRGPELEDETDELAVFLPENSPAAAQPQPARPPVTFWLAAAALVALTALAGHELTSRYLERSSPAPSVSTRASDISSGPAQPAAEARTSPSSGDVLASGRAVIPPTTRAPSVAPRAPKLPESQPSVVGTASLPSPERTATGAASPLLGAQPSAPEPMYSPSFASNGSAVFFHASGSNGTALKRATRGSEGAELHVATIVDDGAENYHVQLSPNGEAVAFDSDRDGERGVYVARPDGTEVRRVSGDGYAAVPTWSPDGRRLAFLRGEQSRPKVWNLWVLDIAASRMTRLTDHPYGQVWGGAWFPDGRRIAYSHEDRLVVLDTATGRSTHYPSPRAGRLVRTPAVSPDGRWMIFQVFRDGAWLLDLSDGTMRRVLDDASAEEFAWAPDGRRVAYHSRRSGEWGLWIMAAR